MKNKIYEVTKDSRISKNVSLKKGDKFEIIQESEYLKLKDIFKKQLQKLIGTKRIIKDGSSMHGKTFIIKSNDVETFADLLATWFMEDYDDINASNSNIVRYVIEYINIIYPKY